MAKLRKMLGDIRSEECTALMRLIETQSKHTLAAWAIDYACARYLPIFQAEFPEDGRLEAMAAACREHLAGGRTLAALKPLLREGAQAARELEGHPVAQAAARAVATACAAVQTPTNALGFLFYGAAAAAYHQAGTAQPAEVYDHLAALELRRALRSLEAAALPDEPNPVKVNWNC